MEIETGFWAYAAGNYITSSGEITDISLWCGGREHSSPTQHFERLLFPHSRLRIHLQLDFVSVEMTLWATRGENSSFQTVSVENLHFSPRWKHSHRGENIPTAVRTFPPRCEVFPPRWEVFPPRWEVFPPRWEHSNRGENIPTAVRTFPPRWEVFPPRWEHSQGMQGMQYITTFISHQRKWRRYISFEFGWNVKLKQEYILCCGSDRTDWRTDGQWHYGIIHHRYIL